MGGGVRDVDGQLDGQVDGQGSGRREFLKKAGKIAFVVPAIQVLSMAPAGAQSNGSVVTTSMPPGSTMPPTSSTSTSSTTSSTTSPTTSSTTSSTTSTTEAPCEEIRYRVKADWDSDSAQMVWSSEVLAGDCLTDTSAWDEAVLGDDLVAFDISDSDSSGVISATISLADGCNFEFVQQRRFGVVTCSGGPVTGPSASVGNLVPRMAHFEAIIVCCE